MIGTRPVPAQGPADIVIYRSRRNARINRNFEVFTAADFPRILRFSRENSRRESKLNKNSPWMDTFPLLKSVPV